MHKVDYGRCLLGSILQNKRMSQVELATLTSITPTEISYYINNQRRMSLRTAKTISTVLNVAIEDLYEWIAISNND